MVQRIPLKKAVIAVLLLIAVAVCVVVIGYFVAKITSTSRTSESPTASRQQQVTQSQTPNCSDSDKIDYLYYDGNNPLWEPNNKFGIYIYAENDKFFERADELVNSNGGEWGYVLIPYNVKDADYAKWRNVFETLNDKKLIPIVQLWDVDIDKYPEQTQKAADFLNSFVWPIRYRYVSVYNEPNDKNFWYGKVDPAEYARILSYTIDIFKQENENFYMLNGALNASAPTGNDHMESFEYMKQMNDAVPGIFNKLDGWASHSYPQPNFSGSPYDTGKWSIKAYDSELKYLKDTLGVKKDLPVFITETGWAHAEGLTYNAGFLSDDEVAKNFKIAFEDVWNKDARVRAVMPFTIRYDPPFDHFSWLNQDNVPYKHFDVIKSLDKVKGKPPMLKKATVSINNCQ